MFHFWNDESKITKVKACLKGGSVRDLNDLYFFAMVVDHGGFAPAGRVLGVPKSRLSRRVAALEERLGVRLIQRSSRRFAVTDTGRIYHQHCKAMLVEADAADEALAFSRAEPCGTVRMSCPVTLLDLEVGGMVAAFMARHPQVLVHLEDTNRRVDVIAEGVDIAIRVRPPPLADSELVLRVLAERDQCLVAAPALLRRFGVPGEPAALADWPSLDLGEPQEEHRWRLLDEAGREVEVAHRPRLVTRSMTALREAALAGVGVVQLPSMMVGEAIAAGQLMHVVPGWAPRRQIVHAVFASRRGLLPAVRALLDDLAARFATLPG